MAFKRCDRPACPGCDCRELIDKMNKMGVPPALIMGIFMSAFNSEFQDWEAVPVMLDDDIEDLIETVH